MGRRKPEVDKSVGRGFGVIQKVCMRNILIIYPHWPPSNLAGVHRPRLVANYLSVYGWHPIILTVHQDYYEETPDWDLCQAVSSDVEVIRVPAWRVLRPRLIGDIGLRAFLFLYKKALHIISQRKIDFIWIPIPSFYVSLIGRLLNQKTRIPYGIDYIDPWIRDIRSRRSFRLILSNLIARALEPLAIRKALLVTGVDKAYYLPAIQRNFKSRQIQTIADRQPVVMQQKGAVHHTDFPYGFDPRDYTLPSKEVSYPWSFLPSCKPLVYAGSFLPHSRLFVRSIFIGVRQLINEGKWDETVHLFFLGTGPYRGKTIQSYATDEGIGHLVHEIRNRFSYFEIVAFLKASYAGMVIGSTEPHYTASKVFSCIMSKRPLFAVLHQHSSARYVLIEVKAEQYLVTWNETLSDDHLQNQVTQVLHLLVCGNQNWEPDCKVLIDRYSSSQSARALSEAINYILPAGFQEIEKSKTRY